MASCIFGVLASVGGRPCGDKEKHLKWLFTQCYMDAFTLDVQMEQDVSVETAFSCLCGTALNRL